MKRTLSPLTRLWLWQADNDMELRDWVDFVLVIAFLTLVSWGVGAVL